MTSFQLRRFAMKFNYQLLEAFTRVSFNWEQNKRKTTFVRSAVVFFVKTALNFPKQT